MIRRGGKKLIYSENDPTQYYDLTIDSLETNNLALKADFQAEVTDLIGEIENRYDHEALIKRVLESQRRRRFLKKIQCVINLKAGIISTSKIVVTLISATPCPSTSWKKSHAFPRCESAKNREEKSIYFETNRGAHSLFISTSTPRPGSAGTEPIPFLERG